MPSAPQLRVGRESIGQMRPRRSSLSAFRPMIELREDSMKFRYHVFCVLPAVMLAYSLLPAPAQAQFTQQGPKLVGTGAVGPFGAGQGWSVSLSADGNTAIVGGIEDNSDVGTGAAWVYTRSRGGIAAALVACSTVSHAQTGAAATQTVPTPQEQSAPIAGNAPASDGLSDLDAMTFGCVKAGLNAAAREAAKVPSQGTYQFSYFTIINDSHHSSYEVHFKSNYQGEADLKYCVSIYCQQGWDPKSTKTSLRLMSDERQPVGMAAHGTDCGNKQAPVVKRRSQ
jgi:hypothetical protein